MKILHLLFGRPPKNTAQLAKERLQIIVAHNRAPNQSGPDFISVLQQEIIEVIAKYFTDIDRSKVKVELQRIKDCAVLELNIALPEPVENKFKQIE